MKINVFGKQGCSACEQMHDKMVHYVEKWGLNGKISVNYIDMETVDGMAEGAFHDILQVPTVILEKDGKSVARYDGGVADSRHLQLRLKEMGFVDSD